MPNTLGTATIAFIHMAKSFHFYQIVISKPWSFKGVHMACNHVRDMHGSVNLSPATRSHFRSTHSQLGIFIIIVTPARIAQYSYDKARLLAATPFGWLPFGLLIGKTQMSLSVSSNLNSASNQRAYRFHLLLVIQHWSPCLGLHMGCGASSLARRRLSWDQL